MDRLSQRLAELGIPIEGIAIENGRVGVDVLKEPTSEELATIQAELDAHDPAVPSAQTRDGAAAQAAAIPAWATWTEAEALAWLQANIDDPLAAATTVAQVKPILQRMAAVLQAMARMEIALRNQAWPELEKRSAD